MSISRIRGEQVDVHIWAPAHEVESQALTQLRNVASLPWVFHHVAAMADCHFGHGATVGSVIAMKGAVSAAAVGVDLGCGMAAIKTNLKAADLPDNLKKIRHSFERSVPVGFNSHDDGVALKLQKTTGTIEALAIQNEAVKLFEEFDTLAEDVASGLKGKALQQSGTLGGGNHFIELGLDTEQNVWLMLHSGSRNIGKCLAEYHINIAKKLSHNAKIPDKELGVFLAGTMEMKMYRNDLFWAQRYALLNRKVMLELLKKDLRHFFPQVQFEEGIYCHHNYVAEEKHYGEDVFVTRKGAIRAGVGELGIIPGSMNTGSFIVRGLGNPESFESASHGAGRKMSRTAARKQFDINEVKRQTEGLECRKDADIADELPEAYKKIDDVIWNQRDLVEVVTKLKAVLCVKG